MESYVSVKDGLAIANGSDGRHSLSSSYVARDCFIESMDGHDDRALVTD